jgi:tetratricopeptide (TPR) repeat protein
MSLSPTPAALLPALSRAAHSASEKATRDDETTAVAGGSGVPASSVDFVALYRQFCSEAGCKANSAVVRYIQDRGGHFSLERLNLGHNYLGAKGLRPVVRMIDTCQTIVSINLEDNGIDNDAVADLCEVLERHVSCTALNLRRNPISVVGGKRLLQLAATNSRMTEILLDGTDIFAGLQERIRMALQHNAAVALGSGLQMEPNRDDGAAAATRPSSPRPNNNNLTRDGGVAKMPSPLPQPRTAASASRRTVAATLPPPPKASLQPIRATTTGTPPGEAAAAAVAATVDASGMKSGRGTPARGATPSLPPPPPSSSSTSAATASRLGWQEAALGKTQPRPPPPAVASQANKALALNKAMNLKALFAERARLHTEVNRGEASRRAYAVRAELQALERHGRPVPDPAKTSSAPITPASASGLHQTYPGAATPSSLRTSTAATTKTITLLPPLHDDTPTGRAATTTTTTTNAYDDDEEDSVDKSAKDSAVKRRKKPGDTSAIESPHTASTLRPASPPRTRANSEVMRTGGAAIGAEGVADEVNNNNNNNNNNNSSGVGGDDARGAAVAAAACCAITPSAAARGGPSTTSQGGAGGSATPRPLAYTVEDALSPDRMMLLTTEEQFTILFDQGCREYMNRNLDAAYMAWNEGMRLAISEGQREWMAVVSSNLQRLSYELLVEEGASHLENGALEKAGETFSLALEVAVKAKNAAWERDMRLAKQNVQKALFHRCHEAALLLFSRAQGDARGRRCTGSGDDVGGGGDDDDDAAVTEDDYFVLPGTEEMIRHTPAFVREWSCLLLLKEAIGLWAEGTRVVSRLSEVAAAPLRVNITEALNLVAGFLVQRHFNDTTPHGLLWFGIDAYLYHECVLLSDLWYDLVADSEQSLHHPLLSAVCAAQLGELYVATYQLPQALVQLEKLVRYGSVHKCPVMEATGLTLCGRLHLQRANYALAEAALEAALELWTAIQQDPVVQRLVNGGSGGAGGVIYELAPMDATAVAADMTMTTTTAAATMDQATTTTTVGGGGARKDTTTLGSTLTSDGPHGGGGSNSNGPRFRIEAHLPTDAIAVLASACRHLKVCLLLQTYRYRQALETLEYGLNVAYGDTLQEKLSRNYHLNPSLDEVAAIAGILRTTLVFYTLTTRYDWSATLHAYQAEESLCMWALAEAREMRCVEVNLTSNFKTSMQELLTSLRQRLCVEPEMALQSDIITELPSRSWQEPLRVLYQACVHPIIGYVRAADSKLLSGDGVITVVPTGLMWLVPFHALLDVKAGDRYLVEEVAIQLAFSATQAAFASLSASRVQQRDLHREVVVVQRDTDAGAMADSLFYTAFPFNADRSTREGEVVAALLRAGQAQVAERQLKKAAALSTAAGGGGVVVPATVVTRDGTTVTVTTSAASVFTHKVEVVENVEALRAVLPRARALHIATATMSAPPSSSLTGGLAAVVSSSDGGLLSLSRRHLPLSLLEKQRGHQQRPEDEGGLLMAAASPMGDVGVIRSGEIAHMELFAEHVILTNTNMSSAHVRDTRDDVLGLVRGFFSSGVPCVIAGQWCTPDMEPMELFHRFYTLWCRPPTTSSDGSLRTVTQSTTDQRASGSRGCESTVRAESFRNTTATLVPPLPGMRTSISSTSCGHTMSDVEAPASATAAEEEGELVRHRALLLARSIRRLLTEEPAMRYRPRVWAGYYCMGTGW